MVGWTARRLVKPLFYVTSATALAGGAIYWLNRPRSLPGSEPPAVPPPTHGEGGRLRPPRFPLVRGRQEQIADLKRSGASRSHTSGHSSKGVTDALPSGDEGPDTTLNSEDAEPYDLLIIGGGATGSGIALDAVTRGLKVAVVERDDFSCGASSKSTKLVHGGVRYLEKAFWELDYNQYDYSPISG